MSENTEINRYKSILLISQQSYKYNNQNNS